MTEEERKKLEQQGEAAAVTPQPSESQRYIDKILSQWEERKKANEKADRRDRVREAIGGIGDVASALAKLHYTTEYAPYVGGENLSEKARQRAAQAKANRDKNLDQWMHYVLNVAGKKQAAEQAARNAEIQQKRIDAAEKKEATRRAEAEKREAQRAKDAKIKAEGKILLNDWSAALLKDEFDPEVELKKLEDQRTANLIDDDELDAYKTVMRTAVSAHNKNNAKYEETQSRKEARGGGGGSKAQPAIMTTHKGFVRWPKALLTTPNNIRSVYNQLPKELLEEISYKYPGKTPSAYQMWTWIEDFFDSSNYTETEKDKVLAEMERIARQQPRQAQQGGKSVRWSEESTPKGKSVRW